MERRDLELLTCRALLVLVLVACDDDGVSDGLVDAARPDAAPVAADGAAPRPDATPEPDAAPIDLTAAVFDPERLLRVDIELAPADWDALRHQTRTLYDVLGPDCLEAPAERPFTWFEGAVTIDGARLEGVGIRKKGFIGSLSTTRPSLKVKFDEYRDGVRWSGMRRLTLNNNRQDPARVRQCLGYAVFAAAGVPSPRCNFARVTVNGADLGVYSNVESLKSAFLERAFGSSEGNLYEGQISDFRTGWTGTFQRKNNDATPDHDDIAAVVAALEGPEQGMEARLEPLVDLDAFLTFWATEVLVGHGDGYAGNTNNFYIYADPAADGAFRFVPWGIDGIMRGGRRPSVLAGAALPWRLLQLPGYPAAYVERVGEVLEAAWNPDWLLAEIDRMEGSLRPRALAPDQMSAALDEVREYVAERGFQLSLALAVPPEAPPGLRPPICFRESGSADVAFETTWGTYPGAPPTRTGASTIDLEGDAVVHAAGGATSGPGVQGEERGRAVMLLVAPTGDGVVGVQVQLDPALVRPGVVPLDGASAQAVIFLGRGGRQPQPLGLVQGAVTFEAASIDDGAPISGRLEGAVLAFGR